MTPNEAKWTNGKRTVSGRWEYYRPSDVFFIELYERDRTTGARTKTMRVHGETPEWGKFRLIRENTAKEPSDD